MKILSGNSNKPLAQSVASYLECPLVECRVHRFGDGEISVEILENVRGADMFLIQSTSTPVNEHLMETLIMMDTLKRASCSSITAVIPYYGYGRQDRKAMPRTPITAKLVADMLTKVGIDRLVTLDLHAGQIQGFFDAPVDNLYASTIFAKDIEKRFKKSDRLTLVSPDVGAVVRTRDLIRRLSFKVPMAIVEKRRLPTFVEAMNVIGDVKDSHCIIVDDIVDSGNTLAKAADLLIQQGAKSVEAYISHGVLSGNALDVVEKSQMKTLTITDSIDREQQENATLRVLTIAPLLGEALRRIHQGESVSSLFD